MHSIDTPLALMPQAAPFATAPPTTVVGARRHNTIAAAGTLPAPVPSLTRAEHNQLASVDGLGITCVIALGGTVAMGWIDAMLPAAIAIAAVATRAAFVAGLRAKARFAAALGHG